MKRYNFLSYRAGILTAVLAGFTALPLILLTVEAVMSGTGMIIPIIGISLYLVILYLGYRLVLLPFRETERMLELFIDGYTLRDIYKLRYPFSRGMAASLSKLESMLNTHELITASKRQSQYLALQNQINPHFLYNTLEGIRGEAMASGMDTIAQMTEALATFFRYTISNVDQLVTLEDELENIQSYYTIQQFRFGSRINLNVEYDDDDRERLFKYRLPKITLQPIVENAIIHGIERKLKPGHIRIKLEITAKRLLITVSDDGIGMDEHYLQELNRKIATNYIGYVSSEDGNQGGIAIVNVNNRIRLLFGEEYGITIYSTPRVGTDVLLTLPLMTSLDRQEEGAAHED